MSKYLEKVRNAEEAIAGEIVDDHVAEYSKQEMMEAATLLGRAQAADRISVSLSSQVIRFLQMFEKTKMYRALGYSNFVTFLNNSGLYDVTKSRYYERKNVLDREGDPLFDALTVAGVPISIRGQFAKGDVTINGEHIVIKGDEDESDLLIHKDDHSSIIQALSNQAIIRRAAAKELAQVKDELSSVKEKHDTEKREIYAELDKVRAARSAEVSGDPHSMAFASLGFAFTALREQAALLSDVDRAARRDNVLEILANQMQLTREAYGSGPVRANAVTGPVAGQSFDEFLAAGLDAIDLDAVDVDDNDAELAAAL